MFVKVTTPDNSVFLSNPDHVRAIEERLKGRSTLYFGSGDTVAINVGIEDAADLFKGKPTSRARKTPS